MFQLDGSLHYTKFSVSAGGVGRNICEALEKLGAKPLFISVVGNDNHGEYLRSLLQPSSTKGIKVVPDIPTAQCTVVLDSNGECKLLLGEMDIHKKITPDMVSLRLIYFSIHKYITYSMIFNSINKIYNV